eukprot:TRINITY_DN7015_c1_g1_i1.p2 TRINITY_DN7015_c1_g1~~TRINITY_DN7015_c1_g1_i1.p2  ORF type:complete len:201 (-),score=-13.95 TRINITY_DN7015_c1_g1_i1:706-1308(-)
MVKMIQQGSYQTLFIVSEQCKQNYMVPYHVGLNSYFLYHNTLMREPLKVIVPILGTDTINGKNDIIRILPDTIYCIGIMQIELYGTVPCGFKFLFFISQYTNESITCSIYFGYRCNKLQQYVQNGSYRTLFIVLEYFKQDYMVVPIHNMSVSILVFYIIIKNENNTYMILYVLLYHIQNIPIKYKAYNWQNFVVWWYIIL